MENFNAEKIKSRLVGWIRDYFEENGKNCFAVVGISGGKDSAVTAALCAEALGGDKVFGVLMPRGEQHDIDYATDLVKHLGINHVIINIKDSVEAAFKSLNDGGVKITEQVIINTPARIRMTTLYAISASIGGRVANTCNLSEDYVGYATKFGDGAGDFSPLMNLTVSEVKAVGRELKLPDKFINKIPEDGLCGKTDEDSLGFAYDVLDKYIREGVCEDLQIKERIEKLHESGKHKLELMPRFIP